MRKLILPKFPISFAFKIHPKIGSPKVSESIRSWDRATAVRKFRNGISRIRDRGILEHGFTLSCRTDRILHTPDLRGNMRVVRLQMHTGFDSLSPAGTLEVAAKYKLVRCYKFTRYRIFR